MSKRPVAMDPLDLNAWAVGRSPSFVWTWRNHDRIERFLRETTKQRRKWVAVAKTAAQEGVPNANRSTLYQAWIRVEKEWAKATPEMHAAMLMGGTGLAPEPITAPAEPARPSAAAHPFGDIPGPTKPDGSFRLTHINPEKKR